MSGVELPGSGRVSGYDVEALRADFPALHQEISGHPLVYLDNAATALKPRAVVDAVCRAYEREVANVHRGVHQLSQRATDLFEQARANVVRFLNAPSKRGVIFVRGTTEAINLVAASYGGQNLTAGDEVLVTGLEHHSNIVPWQLACERTGARLVVAPIDERGDVELDVFASKLSDRTRIVAIAHVSNALGTVLPVAKMTALAHERGAVVVVDGAQAAPHLPIDVQALGCDFYAFSGHKLYGPTGIGVLWGRESLLEAMPPYQGGGEMIRSVRFDKTTYAPLPHRFEAGTPDISGVFGLGAAIEYVSAIGFDALQAWDRALVRYAHERLEAVDGLRIIGTAEHKVGVVSFVVDGMHPHDIGTILDFEGVAVRTGHHCAQPVMEAMGIPATTRASFGLYNTFAEIDRLVAAVAKARTMLAG